MSTEKMTTDAQMEQTGDAGNMGNTQNKIMETDRLETASADAPNVAFGNADIADGTEEEVAGGEQVDFSDEEAQLAADAPEFNLEGDEEHEEDGSEVNLSGMGRQQLLDLFAKLLAEKPIQSLRKDVEAIKVAFYKQHRAEMEMQKKAFIESGGTAEDFVSADDTAEQRFKDMFAEYRKRRDEYISTLERSKQDNLKLKLQIIEELKALIEGGETLDVTFNQFRELQQRWRDAGPVPQENVKDIWETYNHYVEVFYNYIKINNELRDLDLKRNYEAKIALCEEAEALILEPSIVAAFHKLQKLHDQWRETGPVAREYKEILWERFKEASSRINKQHQNHFESIKEEQKRNLEMKEELCVKAEELADGMWSTRKEWNKASDGIIEIQKVWKTIGFAPKKDNTKVYERFRNACDKFFENKRVFYQNIKSEMEQNLLLKNEICEAAEAIMDSEEWKKATDELIALQKRWKEIGPVSRRYSDAVWKRFRAACDRFFERKSQHFSSQDNEYDENLAKKRALLAEISEADIQTGGFDMIKDFQRRWSEIGFVPIKQKDAIQKEYKEAMDKAFSILRASGQANQMNRFKSKLEGMKGEGRLKGERDRLYNKVKQLESEIALLENNIGFFANSKNAESMIADVRRKIEKAKQERETAIEKIKIIDSQE